MDNQNNLIDESALESFSRGLKTCIFRSYYNIVSKQFSMDILYILIMTVEALQIIGLTNFHVLFSSQETNKESFVNVTTVSDSLKLVYQFYPSGEYLTSSVIMYFLVALFTLQFGFFIYFKKREINYKTPPTYLGEVILRVFFVLNILYQKVLSIPIWITFFTFLQCTTESEYINFPSSSSSTSTTIVGILSTSTSTCLNSTYYVNLSIAALGSLQFLIITCLNCEFFHDSRPISTLPWAAPHNKIPYLYFFLKLFLSFFYVFKFGVTDSPMFEIKTAGVLVITIIIIIFRFLNHFFYHKSVGGFTILYEGAFVFNAAFSLLNKYINTVYTLEFLLIQVSTSIFFGYLFYTIIQNISENIIHSNINTITGNHTAHYKLLLLLEYANSYKDDKCKKNVFLGILQKHRLKCFADKCQCHTFLRILNQSQTNENKAIMMFEYLHNQKEKKKKIVLDGAPALTKGTTIIQHQKINFSKLLRKKRKARSGSISDLELEKENLSELNESNLDEEEEIIPEKEDLSVTDCIYGTIRIYLDSLIKNFPANSDLNVFYSYLMTYYMNNIYKSLFELMKVYKRKTTLSRQFEIFFLQSEIEKIMYKDYLEQKDEDFHIENVLTYNSIVNQVLELMNQTAHETILFWTEVGFTSLGQGAPINKNKSQIYEHAMNIGNNIKKMKVCYAILSDGVKFRNKLILKLYCLFLEKIIFNEHDSVEIRERLKLYDKDTINLGHLKKQLDHGDHLSSFVNMDEVGTVVISGNLHDIGKVLIVNHLFCSIFKYEREELNKHSINKVIPAFIAQYHDEFIKRYLETAKKHVLDQIRMVFGISSVGLLTPILLHVKIIPNLENSLRFVGLTKKMQKNHPFFQVPDTDLDGFYISPNTKDISFIMCNEKGKVFGITKPALKQYGIPLNVLFTNMSKVEDQGQGKELNIKNLFANIDDEDVVLKMKSEAGCVLKLDTRFLKSAFEDYKEALQEGNSEILKSLKKFSANKAFTEHLVLVLSYDISFDDGQVPAKIYKVINIIKKIKEKKTKFMDNIGSTKTFANLINTGSIGNLFSTKNINNLNQSILSKNSGLTHQSRGSIKLGTNESSSHNLFSQTLNKGIVEMTHSIQEKDEKDRKEKQDIATMRRGNIFIEKSAINIAEDLTNENKSLNKFKSNLISVRIPKQVKTFIICVGILIFILLLIGVAEFLLTTSNLSNLSKFVNMWDSFNQRNLRFASIILYTRVLMLLDNDILQITDKETKRSLIVSKLLIDLNETISLNNNLIYSMQNIDADLNNINDVEILYTINLEDDFDFYYCDESLSWVIDSILVKISTILENENLAVSPKENLFYYNKNYQKQKQSPELLRELFYIMENSISPVRFWIEKLQRKMNLILSTKVYFDTTARDIICYTPFIFVVLGFITFCVVLSRINDYKLKILRVFFLVDKTYGVKILKRCNKFLENSHNFLKNSKIEIDSYLDDNMKRDRDETNNGTIGGVSGASGMIIKEIYKKPSGNVINFSASGSLNNGEDNNGHEKVSSKEVSNSTLLSPKSNNKDPNSPSSFNPILKRNRKQKTLNGIPLSRPGSKTYAVEKEKDKEKDTEKDAKDKKNGKKKEEEEDYLFNSELEASKSNFRKSLCLIYLKLTILILIIAVYFAIIISMNLDFNSHIFDNSTQISLYATRGWFFNNFLIYFQEMIIQNKEKGYITHDFRNYTYLYTFESLNVIDYYQLYFNQSFYIENSILELNSQENAASPSFLNEVINLDNSLNSNQYCSLLKANDETFYSKFQTNCDQFYTLNLGIKDNIGLISGYVKANPPNYFNQPIEEIEKILTEILPFIENTQMYINPIIFMEMKTLYNSFQSYIDENVYSSVVRSIVYTLLLVCELLVFLYVTTYLSRMLNKDKTILTIIPNEAISSSEKVRIALNSLKKLN